MSKSRKPRWVEADGDLELRGGRAIVVSGSGPHW